MKQASYEGGGGGRPAESVDASDVTIRMTVAENSGAAIFGCERLAEPGFY